VPKATGDLLIGASGAGSGAREAARVIRRELARPRIFAALAIAIFVLLYVGALSLQWVFLSRQAVEDAGDNARAVSELLVLELRASETLSQALGELGAPGRYEVLDQIVRRKLGKFGLIKSKIYDPSGKILYADDRTLVGQTPESAEPFRAALAGSVASRVVTPAQYESRYGMSVRTPLVETYLPLEEGGRPLYVFETYQDFAPVRARLWGMLARSGLLLAVVVGAALGALALAYRWINRLQMQLQSLERLLPICATCKKIRVEAPGEPQYWVPVEAYFGQRDRVEFTHGMCPQCLAKFKAEFAEGRTRGRTPGARAAP
jgi:hypothetical protein